MYLLFSMLPSRATGTEVTILYRAIGRSINFFFLKVFSCVEKYVRKKCIEKKTVRSRRATLRRRQKLGHFL